MTADNLHGDKIKTWYAVENVCASRSRGGRLPAMYSLDEHIANFDHQGAGNQNSPNLLGCSVTRNEKCQRTSTGWVLQLHLREGSAKVAAVARELWSRGKMERCKDLASAASTASVTTAAFVGRNPHTVAVDESRLCAQKTPVRDLVRYWNGTACELDPPPP